MMIVEAIEQALKEIGKTLNATAGDAIVDIKVYKNGDHRVKMSFLIKRPPGDQKTRDYQSHQLEK